MKTPKDKSFLQRSFLLVSLVVFILLLELAGWGFDISILNYSTEGSTIAHPFIVILTRVFLSSCIVAMAIVGLNWGNRLKWKYEYELETLNRELKEANDEMATLNEELRASNEELIANNEELVVLNENLDAAKQTIARQKDEQLNNILDSSNDVIWSMDLTGKNENYLSRSAEKIYGEPLEKLIERPRFWLEHLYPEDKALKLESQYRLEQFGVTECTYRIELPDGIRWIHDRLKLIKDENGNPIRMEGIASDVTELKESERKIKEERNLLRSIIDNIPDNIFVVDRESRNVISNKSAYQMMGASSEEETLGKNAIDYFGQKGKELIEDNERIFSSGTPIINKEVTITVGGKTKTTLNSKVPLRDENGKIVGLIGITRDITERVMQNEALSQYRKNLEIVFDNSSDNFLLLDKNANVVLFNRRFQQFAETFVGITPSVGKSFYEITPASRRKENEENFTKAICGEALVSLGEVKKNGATHYFDIRYNPVIDNGEITHVTISALDITEQKRHEISATRHRENLDIIFQNSTDFFILLNPQAEIILFNRSFLDYTRDIVKKPAYLGMNYYDVISSNRVEIVKELIKRCLTGEGFTVVAEAIWPTGAKFFNVRYTPVLKNGIVTHISVSSTDITEQKNQEIIVNRYRENLDVIFNNTLDHFELIDADGKVVLFNRAYEKETFEIMKVMPEVGMHFIDLVPPHRKEPAQAAFNRALAGETIDIMAEIPAENGVKYFDLHVLPIFNGGKVTHVCRTATDVTEKKNQEKKLNEYRENLDIIFSNTKDHFVLLDPEGNVVTFNHTFFEFVKRTMNIEPHAGDSYLEFVPKQRKEIAASLLTRALKGESIFTEGKISLPDGDSYFELSYEPVFKHGAVTHVCFSAVDITERKRKDSKINEYRESLEIIFETTRDDFLLIDTSGRIVSFNHSYENFMRKAAGIIVVSGMNFLDAVVPGRKHEAKSLFERALQREIVSVEAEVLQADGEKKFHLVRYSPVVRNGQVTHVSISGIDITKLKLVEEELERDKFFLEKASEAGKIGYWTSEPDLENGKLTWSKEVFNIFQIDENEFDGRNATFYQRVHPDDRERVIETGNIAAVENQVYNIDHRILLKNGQVRWVNERAHFIKNDKGEVQLWVGIVQDINDRKIIEEVLREYNDRHEILSRATNDIIWDWDVVNDKVLYNEAMASMMGYDEEHRNNSSKWLEERIHPADHDRVTEEINTVLSKRMPNWESSYRYRAATGDYKYVHDRAYVVYNKEGKPVRMIGAMQDVTELTEYRLNLEKKVEERTRELNTALKKEKELVEMKSKFVSIASHEFRTPLSTISLASGFIKKFKQKMTNEDIDKKLTSVEKQVNHMSSLLDDILTIGKSEAGKIEVIWTTLPIRSFFENLALEVVESTKRSHRVNMKLDYPHADFKTDEGLIRNVAINLLSNAIKFSGESDEVDLEVTGNGNQLVITVRDHGIGIPPQDIPKLFEPFYRAGNVSAISGTGLGLSILKKAVDLLGGEISVKSELGKGTEFIVALPLV